MKPDVNLELLSVLTQELRGNLLNNLRVRRKVFSVV